MLCVLLYLMISKPTQGLLSFADVRSVDLPIAEGAVGQVQCDVGTRSGANRGCRQLRAPGARSREASADAHFHGGGGHLLPPVGRLRRLHPAGTLCSFFISTCSIPHRCCLLQYFDVHHVVYKITGCLTGLRLFLLSIINTYIIEATAT